MLWLIGDCKKVTDLPVSPNSGEVFKNPAMKAYVGGLWTRILENFPLNALGNDEHREDRDKQFLKEFEFPTWSRYVGLHIARLSKVRKLVHNQEPGRSLLGPATR